MKFGKVENPDLVDFTLPEDHPKTRLALERGNESMSCYVGYPRWTKKDMPGLFPPGVKDELAYYSTQYNAIELNATFYINFKPEQIIKWKERAADGFRFFPKVHQYISHVKRLNDVRDSIDTFCESVWHFGDKLGTCFMQLHDNFGPANFHRLEAFMKHWPEDMELAIELRHPEWVSDSSVHAETFDLFETYGIIPVITDTAGRRDLVHMHLTNPKALIRFVGTNHPSDKPRMAAWASRLKSWQEKGLASVVFFIHQNMEEESPLLSQYLIHQFNNQLATDLTMPRITINQQTSLF